MGDVEEQKTSDKRELMGEMVPTCSLTWPECCQAGWSTAVLHGLNKPKRQVLVGKHHPGLNARWLLMISVLVSLASLPRQA